MSLADLHAAAKRAADAVRPGRWFIACDTDADGLCGAAVVAAALARKGIAFQVRASRDKTTSAYETLLAQEATGFILVDKGTSHLATLSEHRRDRIVIVLDHHNVRDEPDDVYHVNPRACGLDGGRDASASTTAAAFALAMDSKNLDLGAVAMSGAIGDWQHRGGWQGWNAELLARLEAEGHVTRRTLPGLPGAHVVDALAYHEPALPGLHGNRDAAQAWLESLGIPDVPVEELDAEAATRLASALLIEHAKAGHTDPNAAVHQEAWNRKLNRSLRHVFRVVDACGRLGHADDGLAFLLGAPSDADKHYADYRDALHEALTLLREKGAELRTSCQVVWTTRPELTGMVGGVGVELGLVDARLPVVILAKRSDGLIQVSTRGTNPLVAQGLDLGGAVEAAARALGEEGGGHPVAAGTVLSPGQVDDFITGLDGLLSQQPWHTNV